MSCELSIVFPAFNEEKRLPPTLDRVLDHLATHFQGSYEIIVVNDGSQDGTVAVVEEYQKEYPQIRLLGFSQNRGYGAAVREGVMSARGEYILAMDADGSVNEEAILRFLKFLQKSPDIGFAVGSRTVEGTKILARQPLLRLFFGNGFLILAKLVFGWPTQDRINGFKMFRRAAADDIFPYQDENSVLGAVEVVCVANRRGWKHALLPILWTDYRGSKIRPWRDAWRSFWWMLRTAWRDRNSACLQPREKMAPQNVKSTLRDSLRSEQ
jgi:dolichyl-phosphate beta-glucosyltransferase